MKREFRRRLDRLTPQRPARTRVIFVTGDEPVPPPAPGEENEQRIIFHTIYEPKPEPAR